MSRQSLSRSPKARNARSAKPHDAERRSTQRIRLIAILGGLIVAGLLAAIVISVVPQMRKDGPRQAQVAPSAEGIPSTATTGGAIAIGNSGAPVKLEVYVDYMCPFCGKFERANGAEVKRMIDENSVRLELYPMAFLDEASAGTRYSTRAANAIATVADRTPEALLSFHEALFTQQPAENTSGLSDERIASLAMSAGVPRGVADLFDDRIFESWVAASTTADFDSNITGTPTVKINGQIFTGDLYSVGPLTSAVGLARAGK